MKRVSRAQAKLLKLKWYFTGIPCKYGHISDRLVSDRACRICKNDSFKQRCDNNPGWNAKRSLVWYHKNSARICKEKILKRKNDPVYAQKQRDKNNEYRKNNPGVFSAKTARRHAAKLKAMPSWVNKNDLREVYINCPEGYEVDHIYPLQGKEVCGLHVPWNLQYLTKLENLRKSNHVQTNDRYQHAGI